MVNQNRENEKENNEQSTSVLREIISWVFSFAVAILIGLVIKNYLIINSDVPTGSMENTIMAGDRLIGNRLAYWKAEPKRGDIVVFHYPDNEEELYVKRVIGLPGETVAIENGKIYIDGAAEPLAEDYLKEEWVVSTGPYRFEIPEDSYLMLGDNRNNSLDARYWENTYVTRDKIVAKALIVYWPFRNMGKLK